MKLTVEQIAEILEATIDGKPNEVIHTFCKIEAACEGGIAFLSNPKYENYIYNTKASAVIVNQTFTPTKPISTTLLRVTDAYSAATKLLVLYESARKKEKIEISKTAILKEDVCIGTEVSIGDFTIIDENAEIGNHVTIYPQVYVGKNVKIGENTTIFAGVKIYEDTQIGANCIIHANTVIGSEGFGFAPMPDGSFKPIPQLGNVIIEDNVRIGANCTIDRATIGATKLRNGVKIDNLVQIAHNVEVGENTVIAAQSGVAGSGKIGNNCMIGGQVAIIGHISVASNTKIGGKAGVNNSIVEEGKSYSGYPAIELKNYLKSAVLYKNLPTLAKRIEQIEKLVFNKKLDE